MTREEAGTTEEGMSAPVPQPCGHLPRNGAEGRAVRVVARCRGIASVGPAAHVDGERYPAEDGHAHLPGGGFRAALAEGVRHLPAMGAGIARHILHKAEDRKTDGTGKE